MIKLEFLIKHERINVLNFTASVSVFTKKIYFLGNIIGGKRHMKVVKAMNIIGPISSVIIVIIVMVAPLATKGRR